VGQALSYNLIPELVPAQKDCLKAAKSEVSFRLNCYQASSREVALWKLSETQLPSMKFGNALKIEFDVHFADFSGGSYATSNITVGDYLIPEIQLFHIGEFEIKSWIKCSMAY